MTDPADIQGRKELLKSASRKIEELRGRLAARDSRENEPVAIIGMGCRFPGGVADPEAFWELLRSGRDGVTEIPADRWNVDDFYDPDPEAPGKMYVRRGGFIDKVREFDPLFFHVSPQEATSMDPQQRILLEVAWEALENAGLAPDRLSGTPTGVFVGLAAGDYGLLSLFADDDGGDATHSATGGSPSIAAGRLSYFFGFRGPCMALDTACASALTAVHLAVQSLRKGESKMALAASINLMVAPATHIVICKARMLSADGKCKSFDASADGYVRSEGCAVFALKLLSQAQADGDRILAVIRSTACNQDGRTNGITAPSGNAQREVIQAAIAAAGLTPRDIDYVEAHGTGTSLGDPIELQALGEVFAPGRPADRKLVLGAVKSNIGHLEGGAGAAGMTKVIMALQKGQIPGNLHFENPNPLIAWDSLPFLVPTQLIPWPAAGERRIAGVSAFGFSGTNCHVVVEEAPPLAPAVPQEDRPCHLLTLSGQTPESLTELAARYAAYAAANPEANLADVCYTTNTGRSQFAHRLAAVAASVDELKGQLERFAAQPKSSGSVQSGRAPTQPPQLGFFFEQETPGELHRELYRRYPVFKAAFDACNAAALELFGASLPASIWTQAAPVALPPREDAILAFALGHATAEQWRDWGLNPAAVSGAGIGWCVAAVFAGALSLKDGLRLAADPKAAGGIQWAVPRTALLSAVTGMPLTAGSIKEPAEWTQGAGHSSDIANRISGFLREGTKVVLAIGAPAKSAGAMPSDPALRWIAAAGGDWSGLLHTMGALFTAGVSVDWAKLERPWARRRLGLPTYPFQRQECWVKYTLPTGSTKSTRKDANPLLGRRIHAPQLRDQIVFEAEFNTDRLPLLKDYRFFSTPVVPAAAMLEMAASAGRIACGGEAISVTGFTIEQPLILAGGQTSLVQTILTPERDRGYSFAIVSAELDQLDGGANWKQHCSGRLAGAGAAPAPDAGILDRLKARYTRMVEPAWVYDSLAKHEVEYGSSFRLIKAIQTGEDGTLLRLRVSENIARQPAAYGIHPALLNAALQSLGISRMVEKPDSGEVFMPIGIDSCRLTVFEHGDIWCHATRSASGAGKEEIGGDVQFYSASGEAIGELRGVHFTKDAGKEFEREKEEKLLASWLFEMEWAPLSAQPAFTAATGTWVIVSEGNPAAAELAALVRQRDGRAIEARPGCDCDALVKTALASPEPLSGLVYFAAPPSAAEGASPEAIPRMAGACTQELLHLTQALARNVPGELAALALVTEGFHAPGLGSGASVAGGAAWGLGRAIAAELPDLHCKLIDLEPSLPATAAAMMLADELLSGSDEDQVALGDGKRLGLRLKRAGAPIFARTPSTTGHAAGASGALDPSGAYLITGGLGGLGLLVARWMVAEGARNIILTGRSAPNAKAQAIIEDLEKLGARIIVALADVGDRAQAATLLGTHVSAAMPLRGVIHAAGVLDDGVLLSQNWARFERVLRPKIDGAWNLHELTLGMPLDFFVLFSSVAGMLGNPGQSNYGAGNVFMDTLAHARRAAGLPALSINWGAWAEVGMAAVMDEKHTRGWGSSGITTIEPGQGIHIMAALIRQGHIAQMGVLPVDQSAWQAPAGAAIPPLYRSLVAAAGVKTAASAANPREAADRLKNAAPAEKRAVLIELVGEVVLDIFGLDRKRSLPPDENLTMIGMDSLLAIQLSNRLKASFGSAVPSTLTFQYPTIEAIADYLLNTLSSEEAAAESSANGAGTGDAATDPGAELDPKRAETLLANLDQLSDSDVEALLGAMENEPDPV